MCAYPSRGNSEATGNNEWGNPAGVGQNWRVFSGGTAAGDYDIENINNDIVELKYRSTTNSEIKIDCDSEVIQGIQIDTLAILGHNLTTSASITLTGSTSPTFTAGGEFVATLQAREDSIYYILPVLSFPTGQFKYWRLTIADATNSNPYIEIGNVVFGSADIFQNECFVDRIPFQLKDFSDKVLTEGFTNVANARAQKRNVRLDFQSLKFQDNNFTKLRGVFTTARTTLKCLWIPTPSETDQNITDRYAVFGKLKNIPVETHNSKGPNNTLINVSVEVDESL
jgi:hypothetical protein